jgi:hypothetical protein
MPPAAIVQDARLNHYADSLATWFIRSVLSDESDVSVSPFACEQLPELDSVALGEQRGWGRLGDSQDVAACRVTGAYD